MEQENISNHSNDENKTVLPLIPNWYTIAMAFALVWNLLGVMAFVNQMMMSTQAMAALTPEQQTYYENIPMLAIVAFAFAVFSGAFGCIAMLMKNSTAVPLFKLSLGGVIVQQFYAFVITNSIEVFGPGGMVMPICLLYTSDAADE